MTYEERIKEVDKALSAKSNYEDIQLCIAMQEEAIREALEQAGYAEWQIIEHLKQNGYIPGKEEE
jgi:hypothetical protein